MACLHNAPRQQRLSSRLPQDLRMPLSLQLPMPVFQLVHGLSVPHVLAQSTHTRASRHGLNGSFACLLVRPVETSGFVPEERRIGS
jgi:hypothetical protein